MDVKYAVNEDFFHIWSNDMAYVLGFWYADGSIEYAPSMRGHYLRISSTDKSVIIAIRNLMGSKHTIVHIKRVGAKVSYLLRIGNKRLYTQLTKLGVTERKSKSLTFPNIPPDYFAAFVRGYFDGDGCVYVEKDSLNTPKRLTVVFTSGSRAFLESLQQHLGTKVATQTKLKISETRGGYGHAYQLRFSTRDSLKLFTLMYKNSTQKTHLERKFSKFREFLTARKHWIDLEIRSILSHT